MENSLVVAKVKDGQEGKGGEDGLFEGKWGALWSWMLCISPVSTLISGYNIVLQFYKMLPFETG